MIQLQIVIDIPKGNGLKQIAVNRLTREDANEVEGLFADGFEERFKEVMTKIVESLEGDGIPVTYEELDKDGSKVARLGNDEAQT